MKAASTILSLWIAVLFTTMLWLAFDPPMEVMAVSGFLIGSASASVSDWIIGFFKETIGDRK